MNGEHPNSLPEVELAVLRKLQRARWLRLFCAGGSLLHLPGGAYSVGSLVIEVPDGNPIHLYVEATETPSHDERFRIGADAERPLQEFIEDKKFRPRISEMRVFPNDLDLSRFLNAPLVVEILRQPEISSVREARIGQDVGVVVSTRSGEKLVLWPDGTILCNIGLTMDPVAVAKFLSCHSLWRI
jgi:hypothetical protein